ncbi:hypothetical protein [Marinomonas transparens]|uniref:Phage tail protein n=1 Tax=Marinomonas transparens TaxID=2795388 RepID=A0A934JNB7_9GAMM|nr:hypothetical protein [Marinomonas transparens]MBJ7537149.1 hypothetical protein [Marinomonas transparens]
MNYPEMSGLYQGKFTDGDPVAGIPASIASAKHMNAVYDELTAAIVAGGVVPDVNDVAQLAHAIGNQLRSKRLLEVSGISDTIILTTPEGMPPVTELKTMDEFSFLVNFTNVTPSVTIQIDGLAPLPLSSVVASHQIFESALLTVRYLDGAFYIASQVNPKTGNDTGLIGTLIVDTMDVVRTGEVAFDGAELSRTEHPILWAIASAASNLIDQASKDVDLITYSGYYGDGDGLRTFTLPILGGEFIRMYDNGRGVDSERIFGSSQRGTIIAGNDDNDSANTSMQNIDEHRELFGWEQADLRGVPTNIGLVNWVAGSPKTLDEVTNLKEWLGTPRPRNIAYYAKTLV